MPNRDLEIFRYFCDDVRLMRMLKNSANITAKTTVIVHSVVESLQSASKNATPIWSNKARIPRDIAISNTTSKTFLIIIMNSSLFIGCIRILGHQNPVDCDGTYPFEYIIPQKG